VLCFGLDAYAVSHEPCPHCRDVALPHLESDELVRPRWDAGLADFGGFDHHDGAAGGEPHAAECAVRKPLFAQDGEAEHGAIECSDLAKLLGPKRKVVNVHLRHGTPTEMTTLTVATHGHCFDGLCSAVAFTHLQRALRSDLVFDYFGAGYGPGQNGVDPGRLRGEENAILDFRFSRSEKVTWYFDHHISAFAAPEDRAAYEAHVASHEGKARRMFHDGAYGSCTKYIADIGKSVFGVSFDGLAELVRWADIIDSAGFPNAEMAVARKEPALQLMTVIEHHGDDAMLGRMIKRLLEESLDSVARSDEVEKAFAPLQAGHAAYVENVRSHASIRGDTVVVDLSDLVIEVASKFVTYALFPESLYSVVLTRSQSKCKISIGYNPWAPRPRTHNIAAICERYGGGGHAVVGAISLQGSDLARAKQITSDVAEELSRP
jgi:hypothetical protein